MSRLVIHNRQHRKSVLTALFLTCMLVVGAGATAGENNGRAWKAGAGEWYVRLTVTTEDGRKDDSNVLGRLADSEDGLDRRDLAELPPPGSPIGDNYLSIVFPHPEWNGEFPDYASDFRSIPKKGKDRKERWTFEIRTHTPGIPATLRWEGPAAVLRNSSIVDAATGRVLVRDCSAVGSYTVGLTEEGVALVWKYHPRKTVGPKK